MASSKDIEINSTGFHAFYKINKVLGSGSFGTVLFCEVIETGEECAVKYFKKNAINDDALMNEVDLLASLDHPNIIKYRACRESTEYIFIEMELCKAGTLADLIDEKAETGRFTELEVA